MGSTNCKVTSTALLAFENLTGADKDSRITAIEKNLHQSQLVARMHYFALRKVVTLNEGKAKCHENPCLFSGKSFGMFKLAIAKILGKDLLDLSGDEWDRYMEVVFHGTRSKNAVTSILCQGFDTSRRSGQAFGPGEYFDADMGVAKTFGDYIIVTLLLKDRSLVKSAKYHDGHPIRVVNNPTDHSYQLCLPLYVVSDKDVEFLKAEKCCQRHFADEPPTRLLCVADACGRPMLLPHEVQLAFQQYCIFRAPTSAQFKCEYSRTTYIIDFKQMTQMNTGTKNVRNISEFVRSNALICWEDEYNKVSVYPNSVQEEFQKGASAIAYTPAMGKHTYAVDFDSGLQKKAGSKKCRRLFLVKRDPSLLCFEDDDGKVAILPSDVQKLFKEDPNSAVEWSSSKFKYLLNFKDMKQTNLKTKKERKLILVVKEEKRE